MARYDKYQPNVSGTRAVLAADMTDPAKIGRAFGVSLDSNGRMVFGAGNIGVMGVVVLTRKMYAGEVIDIMELGEIVEFDPTTAGVKAAASSKWFAASADGVISTTNSGTYVGYTVEAGRLRVNVAKSS